MDFLAIFLGILGGFEGILRDFLGFIFNNWDFKKLIFEEFKEILKNFQDF